MLITVVIPTCNRRNLLAQCLESLFQQTHPFDNVEINVVLDGCTDGTLEYLGAAKFPCASQLIVQPNLGQAAARNAGIKAAQGKYVLLLDDDFVCDAALIEEHLKWHSASGLVVVGPILRDLGDRSLPAIAVDREIRRFYEQHSAGHQPAAWLPPNSSLERKVLLDCGGYDEAFSKAREDTELGMRLADRGMRFQYSPKAVVHQRYTKSAAALVADGARFGRNDVLLLRKRADYLWFSNLSRIDRGSAWKRLGRRLLSCAPFSLEPLFVLPYRALEQLKQIGTVREAGIRVLNLSRYSAWLRAAVKEAGSWNNLKSLIEAARRLPRGQSA